MDIQHLLQQAEQCHRDVALEYFNAFSGQQEELRIAAILEKYPELFTRETYDYVMKMQPGDAVDERQLRFLRMVFTSNYFSDRLKEYTDRIANAEGNAVVEVDGEKLPYRAVPVVLSNEADYTRRGDIGHAYIRELAKLNPLRLEADELSREIVTELGYRDTIELVEKLDRLRVYPMRDLLKQFLTDTPDVYAERLAYYAKDLGGMAPDQVRHEDIGFIMRGNRFDEFFPPMDMVPALARTLKGLGIDLDNQPNTTLDLEERPRKTPRAFCIAIHSPTDVRLVLQPRGGHDDYSTLFHEAGHLQFGAHMSAQLPYVYRNYGDTSVHESYAFLFQHLVEDPAWWSEIMGVKSGVEGFIDFARFQRLYFLRRYGAKLQYEVEYYERGGGAALAPTYAQWLEEGTQVPYPEERYLDDFDGGFYVLQYLQAWIWEKQLRDFLKDRFGEAWFTNRRAGDFLRELWSQGQKYDVWEVAEQLGFDGLDIKPLQQEIAG